MPFALMSKVGATLRSTGGNRCWKESLLAITSVEMVYLQYELDTGMELSIFVAIGAGKYRQGDGVPP
jgi:hypothetical protein